MESPAYDLKRMKEREKDLLEKAKPKEARDRIKQFLEERVELKNLSTHRFYYYSVRLRKSLEIMDNKFLDPSQDDLKAYLKALISKVSERTVTDYIDSYKRFQEWNHKGRLPKKFEILQFKPKKNGKRPEDLITPDEFNKLMDKAGNTRNKALISLLYDSGCRIGEILGMSKQDIKFDQYGAELSVSGKTGYRKVYVLGTSVMFAKMWLKEHPVKGPDGYLFVLVNESNTRKRSVGDPMTYADVRKALTTTMKRAKITKRIHPHLFRHTKASTLATMITEAPLEAQMGWVHGSKQSATYVHLSGKQQQKAILKAYGLIDETEKIETGLKTCPSCSNQIDAKAEYCPFCYTDFPGGKERSTAQLRESLLLRQEAMLNDKMLLMKKEFEEAMKNEVDKKFQKLFSRIDKATLKKLLP